MFEILRLRLKMLDVLNCCKLYFFFINKNENHVYSAIQCGNKKYMKL